MKQQVPQLPFPVPRVPVHPFCGHYGRGRYDFSCPRYVCGKWYATDGHIVFRRPGQAAEYPYDPDYDPDTEFPNVEGLNWKRPWRVFPLPPDPPTTEAILDGVLGLVCEVCGVLLASRHYRRMKGLPHCQVARTYAYAGAPPRVAVYFCCSGGGEGLVVGAVEPGDPQLAPFPGGKPPAAIDTAPERSGIT